MIATSLPLHKAFPSSNLLGLDILRLMTAYNDISWVRRWILDMKESPSDPIGRELFLSKMGFLVRLMMAFVHEGFAVLDQMEKLEEFEGLEHKVDQEGKKAPHRQVLTLEYCDQPAVASWSADHLGSGEFLELFQRANLHDPSRRLGFDHDGLFRERADTRTRLGSRFEHRRDFQNARQRELSHALLADAALDQ